jgi:branched-chain amino acid transport system permease protein
VRFVFKTTYGQDLGLFRDAVQRNWYVALLLGLILLPRLVPAYLNDISLVFIYGLCGLSLMVLAGYTGLVSLGHAAFLGVGAYAHVYFTQTLGLPWIVSVALAAVLTAAAGVLVGLPALRMTGVYLTIATLAFALIIQEVFARWEPVTGGLKGRADRQPAALAHRPRVGRDPRQRDRRPIDGRQSRRLQDHGLRLLGGTDGAGRRPLRAQDRVPGS